VPRPLKQPRSPILHSLANNFFSTILISLQKVLLGFNTWSSLSQFNPALLLHVSHFQFVLLHSINPSSKMLFEWARLKTVPLFFSFRICSLNCWVILSGVEDLLAYFQIREVRVSHFKLYLMSFAAFSWFCMPEWSFDDMNMDCVLVWLNDWDVRTRTVEGFGLLAQASLSRLGEISSTRPFFLRELSLRQRALVLSEKHISLRWGGLA